uniref:Uncharacterized protein n=1 Tax=Candidatus Methanogaster sp. ANME-2c ERB4 TaxID=2759911 RepID=A0A7G9YGD8_9EURY|nr:hypothetical protein NBCJMJBN_00033 [Methanosarcinales archaeon ANME-2c ERB4]
MWFCGEDENEKWTDLEHIRDEAKNFGSLESLRDSEPDLYQINHLFRRTISVLQSSSGQLKI